MSITHVQSATSGNDATATKMTLAYTSNVGTGQRLLVLHAAGATAARVSTVTDTLGTTYTSLVSKAGTNTYGALYSGIAPTAGGANEVTVTFVATTQFRRLTLHEYQGADVANSFDTAAAAGGSASPIKSSIITTAKAGELLFAAVQGDQTQTTTYVAGTNEAYTIRQQSTGLLTQVATEDVTKASTGTTDGEFTFTGANLQLCFVAAFRPPGSVQTLFLNNPVQSGSSAGLLTPTQPATSTSTTGWTVGTNAAATFSRQSYNVENTIFGATVQPSGAPATGHLAEDCWRTSAATTGDFSAGTWYSGVSLISVTAASTGTANVNFRIWRSVNVDGSAAVEITSSRMTGSSVSNLLTTVAQTSSASTQVGAFSLANEYLFLQCAMQITKASGSASADRLMRMGAITSNVAGSFLATSVFSATGGGGGGGFVGSAYWPRVQDWLLDS